MSLPERRKDWATLPALARQIEPPPLTISNTFNSELTSRQGAGLALQRLGHQVSEAGPRGLVLSLTTPVQRTPEGPELATPPAAQRPASVRQVAVSPAEPQPDLETGDSLPAAPPSPPTPRELPVVESALALGPGLSLTEVTPRTPVQPVGPADLPAVAPPTGSRASIDMAPTGEAGTPPARPRLTLGQSRRLGLGAPISQVPAMAEARPSPISAAAGAPLPELPVVARTASQGDSGVFQAEGPGSRGVLAPPSRVPQVSAVSDVPEVGVRGGSEASVRPAASGLLDVLSQPDEAFTTPAATASPLPLAGVPTGVPAAHPGLPPAGGSLTRPGLQRVTPDDPAPVAGRESGEDPETSSARPPESRPLQRSAAGSSVEPSPGLAADADRPADPAEPTPALRASAPLTLTSPRLTLERTPVTDGGAAPQAVPAAVAARISPTLGMELSGTRVLRDAATATAARGLRARAFSSEGNVYLPAEHGSLEGGPAGALLAHELTHVAQQRRLGSQLPSEETPAGRQLEAEAFSVERSWDSGGRLPLAQRSVSSSARSETIGYGATARSTAAGMVAAGLGTLAPDGSLVFPAPGSGATSVAEGNIQRAAVDAAPDTASAPVGSAHSGASTGSSERETEEMAQKLYHRIRALLRTELLVDRERAGLLTDWR